jgi:hypothetical protein
LPGSHAVIASSPLRGALRDTVSRRRIRQPISQFLSDAAIVYSSARRVQTESMNSATGETIGSYTEATAAEAMQAVAAALKAFRYTDWCENRILRAKVLKLPFAKWSK